jgi:hypothetical protein
MMSINKPIDVNSAYVLAIEAAKQSGYNADSAAVLMGVSRLETGNWQFPNAATPKAANNYIGMHEVKVRPTTQVGALQSPNTAIPPYGQYESAYDSFLDFYKWLDFHKAPKDATISDYIEILVDKGYNSNSDYSKLLGDMVYQSLGEMDLQKTETKSKHKRWLWFSVILATLGVGYLAVKKLRKK